LNMENIRELIGQVVTIDIEEYYIFDMIIRYKDFFCLGFRLSPQFADEKMQIIRLYYYEDQLKGHKYDGEDYQFLLNEFMNQENYKKRLQDVINQYKG